MALSTAGPRLRSTHFTPLILIGSLTALAGCQSADGTQDPQRASALATAKSHARSVHASVETSSVPGDADDPAIWVHPTDPGQSLVIGTDKDNGLATWDLAGRPVQQIPSGEPNNVDVRYNFLLGGKRIDIAAAGNRESGAIDVYRIDPTTRQLSLVSDDGIFPADLSEIYGFCLYRSPVTGDHFAFVNDKDGDVEQWRLIDASGTVGGALVRRFDVGTRTEACVADGETGSLFISAERQSIWRYGAEPGDRSPRTLVDGSKVENAGDHLIPEVEGLAIYHGPAGSGYLIASSQGSDDFVVYERRPPYRSLGRFRVLADQGSDRVTHTDGIAVTNVALGPTFSQGLFVAQDGYDEDAYNNFKLVSWEAIARALDPPLIIDTESYDPRHPGIQVPMSVATVEAAGD